jgi:collagen beta-1,O-galactosyltransferase
MRHNLKILGIEFSVFEAVDGQLLEDTQMSSIRMLPGYLDPYHKRPIKRGEIGCFLSHYRIWEEMIEKEYDRILIFEDDIRFTENATKILREMVEDLMKTQIDWDLIYLGRKKNDAKAQEFYIQGIFQINLFYSRNFRPSLFELCNLFLLDAWLCVESTRCSKASKRSATR